MKEKLKNEATKKLASTVNTSPSNFLLEDISDENFTLNECGDTMWDEVLEQEELKDALKVNAKYIVN